MYLGGSFTVRVPDQRAETGTNGKGREKGERRRKEAREKQKEGETVGKRERERDSENCKGRSERYFFGARGSYNSRCSPSEHFALDSRGIGN